MKIPEFFAACMAKCGMTDIDEQNKAYNKLYIRGEYFETLHDFFDNPDPAFSKGEIRNIENMCSLIKKWKPSLETPFNKKAFSRVIGIVDNDKPYYLDQRGGTCTYKSLIMG